MAKGKAANNKQDVATPMTRRTRKRGCSVERKTEDNQGVSHTDDGLVECLQSPEEESEKKRSIEPLILEERTTEKDAKSDLPEVTVAKPLVVCIMDCGPARNQSKIDEQEIVPNEHEPFNNHVEGDAVNNPDGLEQQMTAEDNLHHKIETNQNLEEVKLISIEPVVEGSAKKKRRMGMCHLSEKERNRIIPKQVNRTVRTGKQNDTRMVAKEVNGSSSYPEATDIMPPLRTELLKSSPNHKDQKDETEVETGLNCEDAPKGGMDAGVITKHHEETETQRMEVGFEMKFIALPEYESSLNVCKYETKVTDLSLEKNHCTEEVQTRRISSQEIVLDLCKDYTEPYDIQSSHQEAETEPQPNKTDTGKNLTVTVCNETEAALALPHLDKEHSSRSETEVHLTTTLSDVSNAMREQNPVHLEHLVPEPNDAATLSNAKEKEIVNELHLEDLGATFTNIHKLPEEHVDVDHIPGEHRNTNPKETTEDTPSEQEDLHQQDMKDNMSLENHTQMLESPLLIRTSVSITAPETNSTSFDASHASHRNSEEKTVSMGPPQWRDVSDSQLNTIDMTVQAEADGSEVSPGGYEDVTGLVGALIKELSYLNRIVMATHRELGNLHRRGKNTRNSIR